MIILSVAVEKAKEQVAKMGGRMAGAGLVVGTWGNISVRVPMENHVVITPSGLPYGNLQARDMVVLNLDGQVLEGDRRPSTELELHLSVYRVRADVNAVMHTHSTFASALAVAHRAIPPILEDQAQLVGGEVPVAPYARAGTVFLAEAAVKAMGRYNAVLLANHGVLGVGKTLEEALQVCQLVEKTAQVYIWADIIGKPVVLPEDDVIALRQCFLLDYGQHGECANVRPKGGTF